MRLLNVAFDLTNVEGDFTQPLKLGEAGELSHLPAELLAVNISSLITQQDGHHQDDPKEETGASGVGASFAASLMTEVHPSLQMAMQQHVLHTVFQYIRRTDEILGQPQRSRLTSTCSNRLDSSLLLYLISTSTIHTRCNNTSLWVLLRCLIRRWLDLPRCLLSR